MRLVTREGSVPHPVDPVAVARLAEHFRAELAAVDTSRVEAPSYDELEAYVDGQLDPADAEALATRLEDDPQLAAEVADLERLREQLAGRRGTARGAHPAFPRWIWAAAAALAVAVGGTVAERSLAPDRPVVSHPGAVATAAAPAAPIFADDFEGGDTAAWLTSR